MRLVLDLQACQTEDGGRGMGRYSLSLARAIARNAGGHEIVVALNGRFPASVEPLRLAFDGLLSRDRVAVFSARGVRASAWLSSSKRASALCQSPSANTSMRGQRPDWSYDATAWNTQKALVPTADNPAWPR